MKKNLLLLLITLTGFITTGQAQDGERLQALKIAYLTKKLDLSPEEAQRFWPIYNQYTADIRNIRQEQKQKNGTEIEVEEKILNVRKKYSGELTKALSPDKVNTFFRSEKEFGNIIQRELQERRMERQMNKKGLRGQ
jgi:hypothetical protein